jgi:hypothetical protein
MAWGYIDVAPIIPLQEREAARPTAGGGLWTFGSNDKSTQPLEKPQKKIMTLFEKIFKASVIPSIMNESFKFTLNEKVHLTGWFDILFYILPASFFVISAFFFSGFFSISSSLTPI